MGIDAIVYSNGETVSKEHFINNGFPSDNLRHFDIFGWIPKFDDLIGKKKLVDNYATLMKKIDKDEMEGWYNHIIETGREEEIMAKYIKHCIDNNFVLQFWC